MSYEWFHTGLGLIGLGVAAYVARALGDTVVAGLCALGRYFGGLWLPHPTRRTTSD